MHRRIVVRTERMVHKTQVLRQTQWEVVVAIFCHCLVIFVTCLSTIWLVFGNNSLNVFGPSFIFFKSIMLKKLFCRVNRKM